MSDSGACIYCGENVRALRNHYARHHKAARAYMRNGGALPYGHRLCDTCRLAVPTIDWEAHEKTAHHAARLAEFEAIEEAQAHFTADREGKWYKSSKESRATSHTWTDDGQ